MSNDAPPKPTMKPRRRVYSTDRYARKRKELTVDAAVAGAIAENGLTAPLRAHRIIAEWPDIVGARIASRTSPDGLSGTKTDPNADPKKGDRKTSRILWVRAQNSAWLHELSMLKDDLVARIKAHLGDPPLFDELRFHLGNLPPDTDNLLAGAKARAKKPPPPKVEPVAASPQRQQEISREVAFVQDDDLRSLIESVRKRHDK